MGFFSNIIKGQLIDVIEWTDNTTDTMVHKYDMNGKEIMMGAQLTVRESQAAVFVNEGQLADVYTPGRYSLSTANMPILTALKAWQFGFNSPFKADVYFVSTKQFLDRKWGTSNPVMMRDAELGMIRLRAFGIYAFRVTDPAAFLREVFGTASLFTVEGVEGQIKRTLVSGLSDAIAESKIPALDLAANYEELGAQALQAINPKLAPLGLQLSSFVIENISLPEEVEKTMDRRTSMGVMGDLGKYSQYQAAEAMREAWVWAWAQAWPWGRCLPRACRQRSTPRLHRRPQGHSLPLPLFAPSAVSRLPLVPNSALIAGRSKVRRTSARPVASHCNRARNSARTAVQSNNAYCRWKSK